MATTQTFSTRSIVTGLSHRCAKAPGQKWGLLCEETNQEYFPVQATCYFEGSKTELVLGNGKINTDFGLASETVYTRTNIPAKLNKHAGRKH